MTPSHGSGVRIQLADEVPADSTIVIEFAAKSVRGGDLLSIRGGGFVRTRLTSTWQRYQLLMRREQAGDWLFLNLAEIDAEVPQHAPDGEFLIDELSVQRVLDPPRLCGANANERCAPECAAGSCPPAGLDGLSRAPTVLLSTAAQLRSGYTDAALRVRRAVDHEERNIGFDARRAVDTAAVSDFCGASDCFASVVYDQSVHGYDLRQPDRRAQPKLYDGATRRFTSGTDRPALQFGERLQFMRRRGSPGLVGESALTIAVGGRLSDAGTQEEATGLMLGVQSGAGSLRTAFGRGAVAFGFDDTAARWPIDNASGGSEVHVFRREAGAPRSAITLVHNGSDLGRSPLPASDAHPLRFGDGGYLQLGKASSDASRGVADVTTVVIYDEVLSDADVATLALTVGGQSATGPGSESLAPAMQAARDRYEAAADKPGSIGALVAIGATEALFERGCVYTTVELGTYVVFGPMCEKYKELGGPRSQLGGPIEDSRELPPSTSGDSPWVVSRFAYGIIVYREESGAHALFGPVANKWVALGGFTGKLGAPVGDVRMGSLGEQSATFVGGCIYAYPNAEPHVIEAPLCAKYESLSVEQRIALGPPTSDTALTLEQSGLFNLFATGALYFSSASGAHEIHGAIWDKWAALGFELSELGYPVSDEITTSDGWSRFQLFQNGVLVWHPERGAYAVTGDYARTFMDLGGVLGKLGHPLSDRVANDHQRFHTGGIYTSGDETLAVFGLHYLEYDMLGNLELSLLGRPTRSEYTDSEGRSRVDFEHGSIIVNESSQPEVYYDDLPMKGVDDCTDPSNCNPCIGDVRAQFTALTGDEDRFRQASGALRLTDRPYPPQNLNPLRVFATGSIIEDPGQVVAEQHHVGTFLRTRDGSYAFSYPSDDLGVVALGEVADLTALHAAEETHPSGLFSIGKWVGVVAARTAIDFLDITRPTVPAVRRHLPPGHEDAQPGQGAAMVALRGGGNMLMVTDKEDVYFTLLRGPHRESPPVEDSGFDRALGYSTRPFSEISDENDWQNVSLVTECGTGDLYAIHSGGSDSVDAFGLPLSGSSYWQLSQIRIHARAPYLAFVETRETNQDSDYCWSRGGAGANADEAHHLHLLCAARNPSSAPSILFTDESLR